MTIIRTLTLLTASQEAVFTLWATPAQLAKIVAICELLRVSLVNRPAFLAFVLNSSFERMTSAQAEKVIQTLSDPSQHANITKLNSDARALLAEWKKS